MQASLRPVLSGEQQQTVLRRLLIVEKKRIVCTLRRNNMAVTVHPLTNFKPAVEDINFPLKECMHAPLGALRPIHPKILFFHEAASYQWQTNTFASTRQPSLGIPALTLHADVLKASSGYYFFFS